MNESRKIEQLTGTESTLREILPPSSVEEVGGESSLNESVTPVLSVDKDAVSQTPPPVLEEVTSISSGYLLTSNTFVFFFSPKVCISINVIVKSKTLFQLYYRSSRAGLFLCYTFLICPIQTKHTHS